VLRGVVLSLLIDFDLNFDWIDRYNDNSNNKSNKDYYNSSNNSNSNNTDDNSDRLTYLCNDDKFNQRKWLNQNWFCQVNM